MRVRDYESYVEDIIEHMSYAIADVHILSRPRATVAGDRQSRSCLSYRVLASSFSLQSSRPAGCRASPVPGPDATQPHTRAGAGRRAIGPAFT